MESQQLKHSNTEFTQKEQPVFLVCDQLSGAANIGSIFRLADAFGLQKIFFIGPEFEFNRRIEKTSRSTHRMVAFEFIENIEVLLHKDTQTRINCIALEITNTSTPIQQLSLNTALPTYLVIGNENYGVSESILGLVDQSYHITMYGKNSSMNIAQATGIALYEITNLYNQI